jgi:hypothetical protein
MPAKTKRRVEMLVNWLEQHAKDDDVLGWFLVEAMSAAGIEKFGEFDSSGLDVVLTVNGIEVPVVPVFEFMQSQLSRIKKEAQNHGQEVLVDKLLEKLEEFVYSLAKVG